MSGSSITIENVKQFIVGYDSKVPLITGEEKRYINFDNAASTPVLEPVLETINRFMPWYSSIHRGTGFKSQLSTNIYNKTREIVLNYCRANDDAHIVIYGKNTTEMINKLARRLLIEDDQVVFSTWMEHHSNDLPWRYNQRVVHIEVDEQGRLDLNDLRNKLDEFKGKVRLVAVTGASNVTGYINPVHEIAKMAHEHGAEILVDAAQLAPHRALDLKPQDDPGHIDYLALSAHKIYAPFGQGALVANKDVFTRGNPDQVGGGVVDVVDKDYVFWSEPPEREEAGTPNLIGALALAKALQVVDEIGMDKIAEHEMKLTSYALKKLKKLPGMTIYGSDDENDVENRLGVITFNLEGFYHAYLASILNYEYAVGVRNGCFCAHPYLKKLLKITPEENEAYEKRVLNHDRSQIPGAIRMSFGMYNNEEEVDIFVEALQRIQRGEIKGRYVQNIQTGEYHPENLESDYDKYFRL
ncbi:MAG: aminotransferase class V-fold PLP-dependent enzyme [Calditrichaeota bacterium]|nr:aminotransferase class V-fold PLP-dependent enzyme [Calditrichota bacterium]